MEQKYKIVNKNNQICSKLVNSKNAKKNVHHFYSTNLYGTNHNISLQLKYAASLLIFLCVFVLFYLLPRYQRNTKLGSCTVGPNRQRKKKCTTMVRRFNQNVIQSSKIISYIVSF